MFTQDEHKDIIPTNMTDDRELSGGNNVSEMSERGDLIIGDGPIRFGLEYRDLMSDQGVCIHVLGLSDNEEVELLRFDCFDHIPHYHYGPVKANERLMIDKTTEGDSLDWTINQIRERLPEMVKRAGYENLVEDAKSADTVSLVDEVEMNARRIACEERQTVIHNRGDVVVEAGPVRFGVEFREFSSDRGVAIHVLGDIGGEELELLTFDCFENEPHYHYGPRAKNQRLYLDTTAIPDPLEWALGLFKGGKLSTMLERAGYHDHASRLNPSVVANSVARVEEVATGMREANSG